MSCVVRKPVFGISDQVRHKPGCTVQPQKIARGLKFGIYEEEGLYYICRENKGFDLRLCFCIMQKVGFLMTLLVLSSSEMYRHSITR